MRRMELTERQKKHLRRAAHSLKPVISLGDKGITDAFARELDATLEHHELIKLKVRAADRDMRDQMIEDITARMNAVLIGRIGNVATLYRPRRKNPKIILPAAG